MYLRVLLLREGVDKGRWRGWEKREKEGERGSKEEGEDCEKCEVWDAHKVASPPLPVIANCQLALSTVVKLTGDSLKQPVNGVGERTFRMFHDSTIPNTLHSSKWRLEWNYSNNIINSLILRKYSENSNLRRNVKLRHHIEIPAHHWSRWHYAGTWRLTLQESCAIAKMTAQCALYMGDLKIFGTPWLRPRPLYPRFSWAFVPIDPMNVPTKFEVRSFTRSWDNRGYPPPKFGQSMAAHAPFSSKILMDFYSHRSYKYTRQIWSP